jgi:hypothetical protein
MCVANSLFAALAAVTVALDPGMSRAAEVSGSTSAQTPTEASAWQRHKSQFNVFGFTSAYTCDGLESKVRQILLYAGARNDLKVTAEGCTRGPDALTHTLWVTVDFYSLGVSADGSAAQAVTARWTPLNLSAQRPDFMGRGDCELIDGMKQVLQQDFAWHGLNLQVDCVPHELSLNDFHVQGEVLKAATANQP